MLGYKIFFDFIGLFLSVGLLLRFGPSICDTAEQQSVMSARCLWQIAWLTPSNHRRHILLSLALGQAGQAASKDKSWRKKMLNNELNTCMCDTRSGWNKLFDHQKHLSLRIVNLVDNSGRQFHSSICTQKGGIVGCFA